MFRVNNKDWRRSGIFIVNFEHISGIWKGESHIESFQVCDEINSKRLHHG